jgi:hypothetical protein
VTLTATNAATSTPSGVNFALSFDGANDIVRAGPAPAVGPLTIEAWVRPATNNANGLLIIGADDNVGWSLELNGGRLTIWLSTNQNWQFNQNPAQLLAGQWYHVAATYSGGATQTFVNGAGSTATSVGTLTQGPWVRFGGLAGYTYFNGVLDEVRISNVVRYAGNFTRPTIAFAPDANTLGLWHFDEGVGQTAGDVSASANQATLGSAAGNDNADPLWVAGFQP